MKQLLVLSLVALLFSCAKDAPEPQTLSVDDTFRVFVATDSLLTSQITDIDRLQAVIADDTIDLTEQKEIPALYGFKSAKEFQSVLSEQLERKQFLYRELKLAKLNNKERTALFTKMLKTDRVMVAEDCEDEKLDCFLSVATMALSLHYACIPADATFWGGIACHGAVVVWNYVENNRCNRSYENCQEQPKLIE